MGVIRFLLALAVIIAHSTPIFGLTFGSQVAVPCFFVISGFYMAMILSEKYIGPNSSYWLYLSNRLLRLYPIYFIILIATLAANIYAFKHGGSPKLTLATEMIKDGSFPVSGMILYLFSTFCILLQDLTPSFGFDHGSLYFIKGSVHLEVTRLGYFNLVPQAWSLGSEIMFYLLAPFIVGRNGKTLIIAAVLCIIFRIYMVEFYNYDLFTQLLFPSVLPYFLLGIFSYRMYRSEYFKNLKINMTWSMPVFVMLLILNQYIASYTINFLYPVVFSIFIPFIFNAYKKVEWDKHIGELSYPMYVSHLLIAMIIKTLLPNPFFNSGIFLGAVSVIVSILLVQFISNPIENIRQKRVKSRKQKPALI